MKKSFYIILITALVSCSQNNSIEKAFQTKSDEYWCYYSLYSSYARYYKFNDKNLYHTYTIDQERQFYEIPNACCMKESDQKWSASQDSIMIWNGFFYDIVSYNDNSIVLLSTSDKPPYHSYIFLIKEKEGDSKKYINDFEEKKLYNPEKYNLDKTPKK
jgi:hypothetical protein